MLKFQKVTSLPQNPDPDSIYFLKVGSVCNMYTVTNTNEYVPLTDPFVDKEISSITSSNGTLSIDVGDDSVFFVDVSENITSLLLNNCNTSYKKVTLVCRQNALSSYDISFSGTFKELNSTGGIDKKLSSISIIELKTYNSGTDWVYTIQKDINFSVNVSSGSVLSDRPSGNYYANVGVLDTPNNLSGYFTHYNLDDDNSLIIFVDDNNVEHKIKKVSGIWDTDWDTTYSSVNSINAKLYGLGLGLSDNATSISNYDTVDFSGFYGSDGGEVGSPMSSSIATSIVTKDTGNRTNIITVHADEVENEVRVFVKGGIVNGSRTDWVELYHNNNLSLSTLGGVPSERTINGKTLSSDVILSPSDIGALPNTVGGTVIIKQTSGFTASRSANITEYFLTSNSNQTVLVDETTFGLGDKLKIIKVFQAGQLTVTSGQIIIQEDGTQSLSAIVDNTTAATIELYFNDDGTSYLRIY